MIIYLAVISVLFTLTTLVTASYIMKGVYPRQPNPSSLSMDFIVFLIQLLLTAWSIYHLEGYLSL